MLINKKEYDFRLTCDAIEAIEKLCPDNDLENIEKFLDSAKISEKINFIADMAVIMNKSSVMRDFYDSDKTITEFEREACFLKREQVKNMDFKEIGKLQDILLEIIFENLNPDIKIQAADEDEEKKTETVIPE